MNVHLFTSLLAQSTNRHLVSIQENQLARIALIIPRVDWVHIDKLTFFQPDRVGFDLGILLPEV